MESSPIKRLQSIDGKFVLDYYRTHPIHNPIGSHVLSKVFLGLAMTSQPFSSSLVAVKIYNTDRSVQLFNQQRLIYKELPQNHPNILRPKKMRVFSNKQTYMIMDYCNMKTLFDLMNLYQKDMTWFTQAEAVQIMKDLCNGYKVIQDLGIVHNDINPKNILIHNKVFKIADFGFAAKRGDKYLKNYGHIQYLSPERLMGQQRTNQHFIDIFALGTIFFQILFADSPFFNSNFENFKAIHPMSKLKDSQYCIFKEFMHQFKPLTKDHVDKRLTDIVLKMLCYNSAERATIQQVMKVLQGLSGQLIRYPSYQISATILNYLYRESGHQNVSMSTVFVRSSDSSSFQSYGETSSIENLVTQSTNESCLQFGDLVERSILFIRYLFRCEDCIWNTLFKENPYFEKDDTGFRMMRAMDVIKRSIVIIVYRELQKPHCKIIRESTSSANQSTRLRLNQYYQNIIQQTKDLQIQTEAYLDVRIYEQSLSACSRDLLIEIKKLSKKQYLCAYYLTECFMYYSTKQKLLEKLTLEEARAYVQRQVLQLEEVNKICRNLIGVGQKQQSI